MFLELAKFYIIFYELIYDIRITSCVCVNVFECGAYAYVGHSS